MHQISSSTGGGAGSATTNGFASNIHRTNSSTLSNYNFNKDNSTFEVEKGMNGHTTVNHSSNGMIKNNHNLHKDDDALKKRRRFRRKKGLAAYMPTKIVCTANPNSRDPTGSVIVEWGMLLSILTIIIFLVGVLETARSLPESQEPDFENHKGENFNLANTDSSWKNEDTAAGRRDLAEGAYKDEEGDDQTAADQRGAGAAAAAVKSVQILTQTAIPPTKWPVTLRDEPVEEYDTIIHPGDGVTEMKVPKFWSLPVHNNELMSRETAMKMGSCISSNDDGNHSIGDKCPLHERTIYVGIASYRDFQCRQTVESIFTRAKYPERIRVGVVDQIVHDEDVICNDPIKPCDEDPEQALCKYKNQVDVYEMKAELSIGPVYARHIGYRMYRGEYYATQSDAHVTYTLDWDVDIISQMEATNNEMAVLSTYLTDVQGSISPEGKSLRNTRPIMCNTRYEGGAQGMHLRHGSQPERLPGVHGTPQLQPWWAAGYSFSRGHFVVNVPYDWNQPMIFQGEEMSIGIRGFTIGYDFYAPERSVCFHHYAVGKNALVRNKVHHFWENDNKYAGTGRAAMKRLLGMVHMNPEDPPDSWDHVEEEIYGIGKVRTPEKFYETFGIHVHKKTVEGHLCRFVDTDGRMHKQFTPFLRSDGMGIDYGKISYKFKDPAPDEK